MTYEDTLRQQVNFCERELESLADDVRPEAEYRRATLTQELKMLQELLEEHTEEDSA